MAKKSTQRNQSIKQRAHAIITEHLNVEPQKVLPEADLMDDLGADSLDVVELTMAFEEEFKIEITDDAAESIKTVGDAVRYLELHADDAQAA